MKKLRKLAVLPFVIILTGIATMILMLAEYQRLKTQRRSISCERNEKRRDNNHFPPLFAKTVQQNKANIQNVKDVTKRVE